jgi:hypothetical protein
MQFPKPCLYVNVRYVVLCVCLALLGFRGFYWSELNMWGDGLPDRLLVVLGGGDVLVASQEVKTWLEEDTSARVRRTRV